MIENKFTSQRLILLLLFFLLLPGDFDPISRYFDRQAAMDNAFGIPKNNSAELCRRDRCRYVDLKTWCEGDAAVVEYVR